MLDRCRETGAGEPCPAPYRCLVRTRPGLPAETEPAEVVPISGLGIELGPEDQEEYDNPQILRVPIKVSDDHQSFYLPTTCPTGTKVVLMQRDEQYIFAGVDRLMDKMVGQLNGRRPLAVFHADCMVRGRRMFNRVLKDEIIAKLQYPLSGDEVVPVPRQRSWVILM